MAFSRTNRAGLAATTALLALVAAGCSQEAPTSDSIEGVCGLTGLREGLPLFQQSTLAVATVASVGPSRLAGSGRSQTVYTPVTLEATEVLYGTQPPTEVFFRGGTAEQHTTDGDDYLGLVSGGRVLVSIGMDPSALGGSKADPPGPYVETTFPIDENDKVLVSGCWHADGVDGSQSVKAGVDQLTPQGKVEKSTVEGQTVPLPVVRALIRKTLG